MLPFSELKSKIKLTLFPKKNNNKIKYLTNSSCWKTLLNFICGWLFCFIIYNDELQDPFSTCLLYR